MDQLPPSATEYLCVDEFLRSMIDAQAIKAGLEIGLIDRLAAGEAAPAGGGMEFLLELLRVNGVVENRSGGIGLKERFRVALRYRDLMEAKLEFADLVVPDLVERFTDLIADPGRFMRGSRLMELFDYGRCFECTAENIEHTRRWMKLTTALTRHEAGVVLAMHDFVGVARMLDIGGNSGEFALRACKAHPALRATVADLPVVCRIGREHVSTHAEAGRIDFLACDALADRLPAEFDLVTFKSILHDWPADGARRLLHRADECLRPGGTVLIFERGPIEIGDTSPPYSLLPMLLFFRSFRGPELYARELGEMGYDQVRVRHVRLETPFFMVTARKRE